MQLCQFLPADGLYSQQDVYGIAKLRLQHETFVVAREGGLVKRMVQTAAATCPLVLCVYCPR